MKKPSGIFLGLAVVCGLWAESSAVQELPGGGNDYNLPEGEVSTRSKTIANNYYEATGGGGEVVNGVNLFNLTSTYSIPLGGLSLRGQIAYSVSLNYSGNVWSALVSDNEKAPTLPTALGWGMGSPFVAVNHRNTTTYGDDVVFCDLGPFGGGQLLQHQSTGVYYLSNNPAIRIEAALNDNGGELDGQIESWIFTMPNGHKMFFGDSGDGIVSNSERSLLQNGKQVMVNPYGLEASTPFIYRWDLRLYTSAPAQGAPVGNNQILFEYEKSLIAPSSLWPEKSYTLQSHIKKIKTLDGWGGEIESLNFHYSNADGKYYAGYLPIELRSIQKLYVTKSLDKVESVKNGQVAVRHTLRYSEIPEGMGTNQNSSGAKRLLDSVLVHVEHNGAFVNHGAYAFTYENGGIYDNGNLQSVTTPEGRKMTFVIGGNVLAESPPTMAMKDPDNPNDTLRFPGGISDLDSRYSVRTTCSDRFCFFIVSSTRKEDNGLTYLEVYHNTGRYWRSQPVLRRKITSAWPHANIFADQISVIPLGDRFFIVQRYAQKVEIFDWDGEQFALSQTLSSFSGNYTVTEGKQDELGISLFPGPNFIVIHQRSSSTTLFDNTSRIRVFMENPATGAWGDLTENSNCQVNNSNNHGENVKQPSRLNQCFEFANASSVGSKLIHVSVNGSMFTVVDGSLGIMFAFLLNKNGNGFLDLSSSFLDYNSGEIVHMNGHPNNLNYFVKEPILLSDDYFILKTQTETGNAGSSHIHVFAYDGTHIRQVGSDGMERDHLGAGSVHHNRRIWLGPDYFVTSNLRGDIGGRYVKYWRKSGESFSYTYSAISLPLPNLGDGIEFLLEIHPKSFFVAYYRNGDQNLNPGFPSDPPIAYSTGSGTDYHTYLFRIDGNKLPVLIPDSEQPRDGEGRKYVQLWYSPADNIFIGKSLRNGANACAPGNTCSVRYDDWRFFPHSAGAFASSLSSLPTFLGSGEAAYSSQNVMSSFPSLFSRMAMIQKGANQSFAKIQLMFSGPGGVQFAHSPRILSTSEFIDPNGTEKMTTTYAMVDSDRRTYNRLTGNVDHEEIKVTAGTGNGHVRYVFYLDDDLNPLIGRRKELSGKLRGRRVHKETGTSTLLSTQTTEYLAPYRSPSWPAYLFVNRVLLVNQQEFSGSNLGSLLNQTSYLNYHDGNGMPQFTSQFLGNSKWRMSQTLFNELHLPIQSVVYDITGYEPAHTEAKDYSPNGQPFRNLGGVASTKVEYSSLLPYVGFRSHIWKDPGTSPVNPDQPLSDAELKAGTVPVFKLDRGFQPTSEITRVNNFGQIVETKNPRTGTRSDFVANFYVGKGSWPEATFSSSRADNCAVLLAENGGMNPQVLDLPTSTVDLPLRNDVSRWRSAGAVFDATRSHTGKYSLKVVNDSGPIIDLHLKDVAAEAFDYVISAWVYAEPGSVPVFKLGRRQANGAPLNGFNGAPVEGGIVFKKWQRWELKVTNAQLVLGGLFSGNNDFIRIFLGTPQNGGIIHVDDVVCRPAQTSFVYRTFNDKGQVTSETTTLHSTRYFDLGYLGNVIAVRDEDFRIMGQAGATRLGETD